MRTIILILFLILMVAISACEKSSTGPKNEPAEEIWPFDPPSSEPLDAHEMAAKIGRGFNMGNALEAEVEGEWGIVIQDEYFQIIADAGFTGLRLPVTWPTRSETAPPYTIWSEFFDRVDHVVQEALRNDLIVILNIHHFDAINEDPEGATEWIKALWTQIAEHYKDYPDELYFELLNEPHGAFQNNPTAWNQILNELIPIIRETNPYRMIVVGGVNWNNVSQLKNLELPQDDRGIIGTFHYYSPHRFTHQGASWAGDAEGNWLGTTWMGSPDERAAVNNDFDQAVSWSEGEDRPVFLGEFGSYEKADINSRYRWTDYIRTAAERRNISWTYWEFGAGFGAYNRDAGKWRQLLLKALMPESGDSE